ncbi:MAG TPA: hypothetical protein VFY89_03105 [Ktedonobacterales bacterium]
MSDRTERDQISQPEMGAFGPPPPGRDPERAMSQAAPAGPGEAAPPTFPSPPAPAPAPAPAAAAAPTAGARPAPPLLRLWRLLGGMGALGAAWGFVVVILLLFNAAWGFVAGPDEVLARVGVAVASVLAMVWLAVSVISCLLAGA